MSFPIPAVILCAMEQDRDVATLKLTYVPRFFTLGHENTEDLFEAIDDELFRESQVTTLAAWLA